MPTLLTNLNSSDIKVRWQEPYVSEALNIAQAHRKRGIYFGFDMIPGGSLSVSLNVDLDKGGSLLVYRDSTDIYGITVFRDAAVVLDLTAFAGTAVVIGVAIDYTQGVATTGEVNAYTFAEYNAGLGDVVIIGGVNVPGVGSITTDDIDRSLADYAYKERTEVDHPGEAIFDPRMASPELVANGIPITITNDAAIGMSVNTTSLALNSYRLSKPGATAGDVVFWTGSVLQTRNASRVFLTYRVETNGFTCTDAGVQLVALNSTLQPIATIKVGIGSRTGDTTAFEEQRGDINLPFGTRFIRVEVFGEGIDAGTCDICLIQASSEDQIEGGIGKDPYLRRNPTGHFLLLDYADLREGAYLVWDPQTVDQMIMGLLGKGAANLKLTQVDLEVTGLNGVTAPKFTLDAPLERYVTLSPLHLGYGAPFIESIGAPFWTTFNPGTGNNFPSVQLPSGDSATILLPGGIIPNGATLTEIRLGVDGLVDANFNFDVELKRFSKTSGGDSILTSSLGLPRNNVSTIDQVVAGGLSEVWQESQGGDRGIYGLKIDNNSPGVTHYVLWIDLTYEVTSIEAEALGLQ
jgi:hypothetical protein